MPVPALHTFLGPADRQLLQLALHVTKHLESRLSAAAVTQAQAHQALCHTGEDGPALRPLAAATAQTAEAVGRLVDLASSAKASLAELDALTVAPKTPPIG